jgi:glycosyltransferase involved in cell wall biosynthesis
MQVKVAPPTIKSAICTGFEFAFEKLGCEYSVLSYNGFVITTLHGAQEMNLAGLYILYGLALFHVLLCLYSYYNMCHIEDLPEGAPKARSHWPRISVIIPACNEEATIGVALKSVLESQYPNFEVIVVNDRSTDNTGVVLAELSAQWPQLIVLQIDALPEGWLGKLNALRVGTEKATGEYLLFSDADVEYDPTALSAAMDRVLTEELDFLALLPYLKFRSRVQAAAIFFFGTMFFMGTRVAQVNRGVPSAYVGIGAFNLVRRSTFERTRGWQWLKLEIADDLGLAYMVNEVGGKGRVGIAPHHLALEWYPDTLALMRGLEKNSFAAVGHFSLLRSLVLSLGLLVCPIALLGLLFTPLWGVGLLSIGGIWAGWYRNSQKDIHFIVPLLSVFMGPFLAYCLMRSTWLTLRRGSVEWRGTRYGLQELKEAQRVRI